MLQTNKSLSAGYMAENVGERKEIADMFLSRFYVTK